MKHGLAIERLAIGNVAIGLIGRQRLEIEVINNLRLAADVTGKSNRTGIRIQAEICVQN